MKHYVVIYHKEFKDLDDCTIKGTNELDLFKSRMKDNEHIDYIIESNSPISIKQ